MPRKVKKARIDANLAAIEVAKKLLASGETATPKKWKSCAVIVVGVVLALLSMREATWSPNPINKRLREILTPKNTKLRS